MFWRHWSQKLLSQKSPTHKNEWVNFEQTFCLISRWIDPSFIFLLRVVLISRFWSWELKVKIPIKVVTLLLIQRSRSYKWSNSKTKLMHVKNLTDCRSYIIFSILNMCNCTLTCYKALLNKWCYLMKDKKIAQL